MEERTQQVEWALTRLLTDDLAARRTRVIDWGPVYLQWTGDLPGTMVVELTSNRYLPDDHQLSPVDEEALSDIGFDPPGTYAPNWTTWVATPDEAIHVARSAIHALSTAYHLALATIMAGLDAEHLDADPDQDPSQAPAPVVPLPTLIASSGPDPVRIIAAAVGPRVAELLLPFQWPPETPDPILDAHPNAPDAPDAL